WRKVLRRRSNVIAVLRRMAEIACILLDSCAAFTRENMHQTSPLFRPLRAGSLVLRNRIVMAPMTRSRADEAGVPSRFAPLYYGQRASAGLVVTEATNVSAMAKGYVRTPGLFAPAHIAGWRTVTDAVHAEGGRIFAQLFHTGRIALPDLLP